MKWSCKTCRFEADTRTELLKHYRLRHGMVSRGQTVPCLYKDCPCSFKTFNALNINLSRQHPEAVTSKEILSFSCVLCSSACFDSERQYFEHLGSHLRRFEVVACVFKNCTFSSNVYSTFASHRHRKHSPHGLEDFKDEVLKKYSDPVYWILGNIPAVSQSALTSINLAVLCKAVDTKTFGYQKVLEPLLTDLRTLERDGLFVPGLGKVVKRTVMCVAADNLGAHSAAGFVESFSGSYFCRFCLAERSEYQSREVRSVFFSTEN